MKLYSTDDILVQLEADGLYDLIQKTIDHDLYSDKAINKFYLSLLTNADQLRNVYPYYWASRSFSKEIKYVLSHMLCNDPNGDWDELDVLETPLQTIETIENWKEDLEDAYEEVPGWMDKCIDVLMLFVHLN